LEIARARFGDQAKFILFNGRQIPFPDGSFDLVFAACVFHHIDHREHMAMMSEFFRVLKPGGLAVIYEHNPYNPMTRHVVNSCPFDENARMISARTMRRRLISVGFPRGLVRYRVFFPSALRLLRPLERFLVWLPIGAQYYVAARK
jgi:ubiquinone/menaquinone biosynthesis C-methylase UbiE